MLDKYVNQIGCDPEFFFEKGSKVVESGVALKEEGGEIENFDDSGKVIQDGFQGEFNPASNTCRQSLAWNIARLFGDVDDIGYKVKLGGGYLIPEDQFATLSNRSKTFGCIPSENVYGREALGADPKKYMFRPAGGHIHLSLSEKAKTDIPRVVKLLDIFVGNTCVPFDQDPTQVERRKNYGRAGEFRKKSYGVEYRTPSNFWLNHYVYMSMIFGLARQAISIATYDTSDSIDNIIKLFPNDEIEKAINSNDKDLAITNFKKLENYINERFKYSEYYGNEAKHPINSFTFPHILASMERGYIKRFKQTGHRHWMSILSNDYLDDGFESTLLKIAKHPNYV